MLANMPFVICVSEKNVCKNPHHKNVIPSSTSEGFVKSSVILCVLVTVTAPRLMSVVLPPTPANSFDVHGFMKLHFYTLLYIGRGTHLRIDLATTCIMGLSFRFGTPAQMP